MTYRVRFTPPIATVREHLGAYLDLFEIKRFGPYTLEITFPSHQEAIFLCLADVLGLQQVNKTA